MVTVEATTIVNIGKHHLKPGDQTTVLPGLAADLVKEKLVKIVEKGVEVAKKDRADDGQYAEEPATPTFTSIVLTKIQTETPVTEEVVADETTAEVKIANVEPFGSGVPQAEGQADKSEQTLKEEKGTDAEHKQDKETATRQTKEDKAATQTKEAK